MDAEWPGTGVNELKCVRHEGPNEDDIMCLWEDGISLWQQREGP